MVDPERGKERSESTKFFSGMIGFNFWLQAIRNTILFSYQDEES